MQRILQEIMKRNWNISQFVDESFVPENQQTCVYSVDCWFSKPFLEKGVIFLFVPPQIFGPSSGTDLRMAKGSEITVAQRNLCVLSPFFFDIMPSPPSSLFQIDQYCRVANC